MSIPPPSRATRQIGRHHWVAAAHNLLENSMRCCVVSSHHKGWVYLLEQTDEENTFRYMIYKVGFDPCKIKKGLYNYTITNGNLIDASFISTE